VEKAMSETNEKPLSDTTPDDIEGSTEKSFITDEEPVLDSKMDGDKENKPSDEETPESEGRTMIEAHIPRESVLIEAHAPHQSALTVKEFFVHIAIVTIGLLLAIGLEQTMEYFLHRHMVKETREELRIERENNVQRFALQTQEFYRFVPKLKTNLAIYQYLRQHPAAPAEKWPGKFDWFGMMPYYADSVWMTAKQSGVMQYMPQNEVRTNGILYKRLESLSADIEEQRKTKRAIFLTYVQQPDVSRLAPEQLDKQILLTSQLLLDFAYLAIDQVNIQKAFPDFTPSPTIEDRNQILHLAPIPAENKIVTEENEHLYKLDQAEEENRPEHLGQPAKAK
jgi:hypothetical protein